LKNNIIISHEWQDLLSLLKGRKVVVISDRLVSNVPLPEEYPVIKIDASESGKGLSTVERLVEELLSLGADRDTVILGVGGGITTDIAGFTASIYKRGLPFGFVPTTLLAQVDASIGGKNGVNFKGLKNMVGVIRQPEMVFINPDVLSSLPPRTLLCGVAEMLKAFIIADRESFVEASADWRGNLEKFIRKAVEIKCRIVEQDETEKGLRRVLNLGHTFAHAIETNGGMTHGEAVAVGICVASRISCSMGILSKQECALIVDAFEKAGFDVRCPFDFNELEEAISQDKKAQGKIMNFVLPVRIGEVRIEKLTVDQIKDGYCML